jgi:hypothetical protein
MYLIEMYAKHLKKTLHKNKKGYWVGHFKVNGKYYKITEPTTKK